MPEPTVIGTDILRRALLAHNSKPHALTAVAREIEGIGVGTLEAFATGNANLSIDVLKALTRVM